MNKKIGQRAGGADRVQKLAVNVAANGSKLVKAQAVLAEAVRAGVDDDPYKVRAVWVAEMANTVAKAAYESARADANTRITRYVSGVIKLPSEARDHRRRRNQHNSYRKPPCSVAEYVERSV